MNTLNGLPVDRPPVCFYELNGLDEDPSDPDPFNIYSHPSWLPLIELTRGCTDRIPRRYPTFLNKEPDPLEELTQHVHEMQNGSRISTMTIRAGDRILTSRSRRDPDINTSWTTEHLLKDVDDLRAYLELPLPMISGTPDVDTVLRAEAELGDTGIVMIDTSDPLCCAAALFNMEDYTVIALTEPELFHRLLQRFASVIHGQTELIAEVLPGRLWRIFGPEYASPPYLPPRLFEEYVVRYVTPMVEAIQEHGGFARIHSHGNLKAILDMIASTGCTALDPIEPPPQGDVSVAYVREHVGEQMTLFGNIEVSDIENLETAAFREKVRTALREGTEGKGRGFVLMPSACPYGRILPEQTLRNYEVMVEEVERWN